MISNNSKTAIKAVIFLCSQFESESKSSIKEVAAYINANEHTVAKILQQLVKNEIINSVKGPSGGFFISTKQQALPIISIVQAIEGAKVFKNCGLGLSKCSAQHPCPIHNDYKLARDIVEDLFKSKKVIDLCSPVNEGIAYLID
ncbi:MAG: Rrf2 family transcriptional regulator [Bacteroidetes bacterium]|nr:Rrf2 family transcriptional regulator [Bacteroidota bacterium]